MLWDEIWKQIPICFNRKEKISSGRFQISGQFKKFLLLSNILISDDVILKICHRENWLIFKFFYWKLLYPSQDSSIASTSAWYLWGPGFKSRNGREFFSSEINSVGYVWLISKPCKSFTLIKLCLYTKHQSRLNSLKRGLVKTSDLTIHVTEGRLRNRGSWSALSYDAYSHSQPN